MGALHFYRCGFLGVRYLEAILYCLVGIQKRPPLGGYLCISTIVISIRNTAFVRCREVVRFSEGPLLEVRLQSREPACIFPYTRMRTRKVGGRNAPRACVFPGLVQSGRG